MVIGLITVAVVIAAAVPLTVYARGGFDDRVTVQAVTDQIGDGLTGGGDVKFRGLIVGRVDTVRVIDGGRRQEITMSIDAAAAHAIPDEVSAVYQPSNILGVTGIELKAAAGAGPGRLRDGSRVQIGAGSTEVSVSDLLQQLGAIATTITGDSAARSVEVIDRVIIALQPALRSGVELLDLAAQRRQMPLSRFLQILGPTTAGTADLLGPFLSVFTGLSRTTAAYADPKVVRDVGDSLTGLIDTVISLGRLAGDNLDGLAAGLDLLVATSAPLGRTLRSIPPAVGDARELLRRLEQVVAVRGGRPTVRVGVSLANLPQITAFLPGPTGGGR
ncbi:MlaD family protein [Williamsia sp. CHRR-6]|uniref:MlaD family protein n=1 Tax=Williamsia sp. CHRR-6 TaxID=2835871 RepID=UPI001BDB2700|nr:MlaD family protein [Williamsia sp. CHRR-6]MBT0566572.1 MCE family protein [Williamsia sp. CHRR-6]